MLSGELIPFIESIEYKSKKELLGKLRNMRENTVRLSKKDRRIVKQMIGVAIQQVYYTPESELLKYANNQAKEA